MKADCPADLALLRSGCDDEETWRQEYGCEFISDAQNYIPIELIGSCVHEEATTEWNDVSGARYQVSEEQGVSYQVSGASKSLSLTPDTRHLTPSSRDFYLGIDIARKRDFTIAWLFEKVGGILWSRQLTVMKGVSFDEQEKAICRMIEGTPHPASSLSHPLSPRRIFDPAGEGNCQIPQHDRHGVAVRRVCVDQSGVGMMLAEHLVQKYGAVVEPVTFTAALKERIAPLVKRAFEDRTVRIPDHRDVRADINSVKRFVTPAGNIRFDAEHTDRGHADRFWALAMVVNAASEPPANFTEQAFLGGAPVMAGFGRMVL